MKLLNVKHNKYKSRAYSIYQSMKKRCNYPKATRYEDWGGRGIKVCPRWNESFEAFYADMGDPPPGTTLDRKNNDGDYEPGNCRWAVKKEQANNTRRNVFFTYQDKTQTISQWAEEYGMSCKLLWGRLRTCGWSIEKALMTPPLEKGPMMLTPLKLKRAYTKREPKVPKTPPWELSFPPRRKNNESRRFSEIAQEVISPSV